MDKSPLQALQGLHEGLGHSFSDALSALLRITVGVKLLGVDQIPYSEFVLSTENPTCCNLLKVEPLSGNWILDINLSILYPLMDRMLGGGHDGGVITRRPLTEIELRLVSRITSLFLEELRRAWAAVLDLRFEVLRVESNPRLLQIIPPNETLAVVRFELALRDTRGLMTLCIPGNAIERIAGQQPERITPASPASHSSLVELQVQLAHSRISASELSNLSVGDIITTDTNIREPLLVHVEGVPKFHAYAGALKGHKAIRIDGGGTADQ